MYREVLELENFPFDRQLLRIYIEIADINPLAPALWDKNNNEDPFVVSTWLNDFAYAGYQAAWRESLDPGMSMFLHYCC